MVATSPAATHAQMRPPAPVRRGISGWLRHNLFRTRYDTLLTVFAAGLVLAIAVPTLSWALNEARWNVIWANLRLLLLGQYPADQTWRIWLTLDLLVAVGAVSWGLWVRRQTLLGRLWLAAVVVLAGLPFDDAVRANFVGLAVLSVVGCRLGRRYVIRLRRPALIAWLVFLPLAIVLVHGLTSDRGLLPVVSTGVWGGLLLTVLMAIVAIVFSLPFGVLLALGRQSRLPIVRLLSIAYIEVVRGLPVIVVFFIAQTMLPLFLPPEFRNLDRVLRAMVGLTLFTAAYQAENVRGGLQALPRGQHEAAYALGLNAFQATVLVILPQALRSVIPVLVNRFVIVFQDTSLVAISGLIDLVGIARAVTANPKFMGQEREVYLFVALLFWVFCITMSYAARRIETHLGVGER